MKIIAAFKTHFDIGYTRLASEVMQQYSGPMLDDVLAACEGTAHLGKGRRYVWTMAGWPLAKMLEDAAPEKRARAEELIRRGQLVPHGLPFTTHTELLTQDELSYGCLISKRLCDKYGIPQPKTAKMTDVPGHTAGLVDVLAKNGISFLHLGCNPASMYPNVPTLFWWESKNGNRVLTMYNSVYGSDLLPPKDWQFPVWLAMLQTYDNLGPQAGSVIGEIEKQAEGKADLWVGTMDDFWEEISCCDLSGLPVIRGELGDTWIHGVGTNPREVSALRRARDRLRANISKVDLSSPDAIAALDTYYDNALLFGEHTWGLDVRTYLGGDRRYDKAGFLEQRKEPRFVKIERSWEEKRDAARRAVAAAEKLVGTQDPEVVHDPTSPFRAEVKDGQIVITLPTGEEVRPSYEYDLISFWKMSEFERHYMQRMCHWGLSDFGRDGHPEDDGAIYAAELVSSKMEGGKLIADYVCPEESYAEYGNAKSFRITVTCMADRVNVELSLKDKQASPRLEALNMNFDIQTAGKRYLVTKCGQEIDPRKDIVDRANNLLYSAESYAAIDKVAIRTIDAPLTSFGGNAIFEKTLLPFRRPQRTCITFNLFNNQWGTNFPLYYEGDMRFAWEIMPLAAARKKFPLSRPEDLPLKK